MIFKTLIRFWAKCAVIPTCIAIAIFTAVSLIHGLDAAIHVTKVFVLLSLILIFNCSLWRLILWLLNCAGSDAVCRQKLK